MNIDRAVKSALAGKLGTLLCANAELGVVNEHLLATVNTQQAKIAELEAKISELAAKEAPQNGVAGAQAGGAASSVGGGDRPPLDGVGGQGG